LFFRKSKLLDYPIIIIHQYNLPCHWLVG